MVPCSKIDVTNPRIWGTLELSHLPRVGGAFEAARLSWRLQLFVPLTARDAGTHPAPSSKKRSDAPLWCNRQI